MSRPAIGFTGTRDGLTREQEFTLNSAFAGFAVRDPGAPRPVLHHGDCVGADAAAHELARRLGYGVVVHPPSNARLRAFCDGDQVRYPASYLKRNQAIVDACSVLTAAPRENAEPAPARGQGTWSTVRRARRAGRTVMIHWPDGRVEVDTPHSEEAVVPKAIEELRIRFDVPDDVSASDSLEMAEAITSHLDSVVAGYRCTVIDTTEPGDKPEYVELLVTSR